MKVFHKLAVYIEFTVPSSGRIISITTYQSAWNFQDIWDLRYSFIYWCPN
ncbi:hypothetical protein KM792_14945 [Clostridium tyrobutyricum]|uniref:Uncharacterized protein n=1 Tax=Clostridium tyrobutyricum DIVETGP TaxID=1408889 RepID=W6NH57_CLOTY|nr:hypothetical protein [Clostridium tyrobutyricum]AND84392.1 hypothetical protein CTK_C11310 [Clostridium tyrobutyricum]MBR9649307.1 hypothetical protein [Clostridium tyrobutyricum]MBV4417659.1 hypothetical protein [Clostridium tyrobutyricum]MBV4423586.1 hypothetical protein [Clostridium tyrobutyricum]MBV4425304.1 hypothetical protein [Clostridium tyrobutyricum]